MSLSARGRSAAVVLAFLLISALGVVTAQRQSAAASTLVVWTIGDSITYGTSSHHHDVRGGYRLPLARILLARGVRVHYVGTSAANGTPALAAFGQRHDGHRGWRVGEVLEHVNGWNVPTPDAIVVHLGTNDLRHRAGRPDARPVDVVGRLADLATSLSSRFPEAVVVLSTVIPSGVPGHCDEPTRDYDRLVRELVISERTAGYDVVLADQWAGFTRAGCATDGALLSSDHLHPSAHGYAVMAKGFADVLERAATTRRTLTP